MQLLFTIHILFHPFSLNRLGMWRISGRKTLTNTHTYTTTYTKYFCMQIHVFVSLFEETEQFIKTYTHILYHNINMLQNTVHGMYKASKNSNLLTSISNFNIASYSEVLPKFLIRDNRISFSSYITSSRQYEGQGSEWSSIFF